MGVISSAIQSVTQAQLSKEQHKQDSILAYSQMNHEKELAERQFNYNKTLAEEEFNRNIEQWQKENEYNLPANQMLRYQQAGLNPNLVTGQQNLSANSPTYHSPTYSENSTNFLNRPLWNGSIQPFNLLSDIFQLINFGNMIRKGSAEATIAENNAIGSGFDASMKGEFSTYYGAIQEAKLHNLLLNNENSELRNEWQSFLNSTKQMRREIMQNTGVSSYFDSLLKSKAWNDLNRFGFDPSKGNWINWLGGFATNLFNKFF